MLAGAPRVVVVDHYDSFSWNMVHALERAGARCRLVAHDGVALEELFAADGVVLSAGPCTPRETVVSVPLVRAVAALPQTGRAAPALLGVCLGHQCIAAAFGARVGPSARPLHGRVAEVRHDGRGVLSGVASPAAFARYNSLAVAGPLPEALEACAWDEGGEIMALRHRTRPIAGVQFHPESHLSDMDGAAAGARVWDNWVSSLPVGRG